MESLRDEIIKLNEERQIELDQKQNARVREIQLSLAEDLETCRSVPAALKALDKEHRASVREALETLELIDIAVVTPKQAEIVDTVHNRVRYVRTLLDQGADIAKRAVAKVDDLTFAQIKDWSPIEYARALRNDLQSASSAPQTIKIVMTALPIDMEAIRKILKSGPRREDMGTSAKIRDDSERPIQAYAHSQTAGT